MKGFPAFLKKMGEQDSAQHFTIPHLQAITDIHLNSHKDRELEDNGSMLIVYIMCLTGLIILIVSWINYLNLTLAGIYNRSRSLYLLKVNAASSADLFYIYFIESTIIVITSFYIAIILIEISFPYIKTITGNVLNENIFQFLPFATFWIFVILLGTLIIGSIPILSYTLKNNSVLAFFRSGKTSSSKRPSSLTRIMLIVIQFSLTVFLIICSLVIGLQSRFILNHQTGADQDSVLSVKIFNQDIIDRYELIKSGLSKSPYINDVTSSFEEPYGETMDAMGFETRGIRNEFKDLILWVYPVDENYFDFYNIPIIAGSNFPPYNEKLKREDYILNETAVRSLGWTPEEAIGKPFKLKFNYGTNVIFGGRIVGVVKDFSVNTLHREIRPFVFFQKKIWYWSLLIKVDQKNRSKAMAHIQKTWEEIVPNYPLEYSYNKDLYFKAYKKEIVQSRMSGFFSILAILISCLGLFAISSIIITRRTKEIGIRKTNGAKTWEIVLMLSKDFMKWVLVAYFIASPVTYYAMHKWLQNFAYKTPLYWWIFIIAGVIVFLVALFTVSFQSLKVASKNPVESLRYE
jgi:putative ABC transport system permease protein